MTNPLAKPEFPRSNAYDPELVMAGNMGPNALWLMEWLGAAMDLKPGSRVLDLGCGTALSSIFLAQEYGVRVHAADLWVAPDDNLLRLLAAGVADRVCPLQAEAHALPFAGGYFDAVTCVDAYQYFGSDTLYLHYLSRFVRPGGKIGVVVPALMQPLPGGPPAHLTRPQSNGTAFWEDECIAFRTLDEWRVTWERCSRVALDVADTLPEGWRHWRDFERALEEADANQFPSVAEALDADQGRTLGFVRLVATRTEVAGLNLYDPGLVNKLTASAW